MSRKYIKVGRNSIFFDETYFIAYTGGKRELPEKQKKEYNRLIRMPFEIKKKEMLKMPMENNPYLVPIKGIVLAEFIKERGFIPLFDKFFEHTKMIQLSDAIVYEAMKAKNYEMAM